MLPFRFTPQYQLRLWGGDNLAHLYGRTLPPNTNIGESWEIADTQHVQSTVAEGEWQGSTINQLWNEHRTLVFGDFETYSTQFPILCKLLDAQEHLSLQVHPPEATAQKWGGAPKSETWLILHASPRAQIWYGWKQDYSPQDIASALQNNTLESLLQTRATKAGDIFPVPTGTVHALGKGNVIFEAQQTSDTTYRLYDWGRLDDQGLARELHIPQALDSIAEAKIFPPPPVETYLHLRTLSLSQADKYTTPVADKFAIIFVMQGEFTVEEAGQSRHFTKGDTILFPSNSPVAHIATPTAMLAEVTLP